MKKVKIGLLLATLCAASVFAQGVPATDSIATIPTTVTDSTATATDSGLAAAPDSTIAAEVPAEPPVPVPAPEPVKVAEPAPIVLPPPAAAEPSEIKFHFGARFGVGVSHLYGPHVALGIPGSGYAIFLKPAISFGAGLAFAIEINSLFAVAPELQYTWYRANGEQKSGSGSGKGIPYVNKVGASLHSLELPILARFSFGSAFYAELGPQIGYNFYASIYKDYNGVSKNGEEQKLEANSFAFGPSLGFGTTIDGIQLGIRTHLGMLEYADNTNGYPWTLQISATKFFF